MNRQPLKIDEIFIEGHSVPCFVFEFEKGDMVWLPADKKRPMCLKKGKHKLEYLNIYCGFDIETTNIVERDEKDKIKSAKAFMYIWQFAISSREKCYIYLGRTWEAFTDLLKEVAFFYHVSRETRLIIWDANFGFEFQFIRKHIKWCDDEFAFFAKETRKPLLATCYDGLEFRDCLAITGGSLEQLAKDYCTTKKMIGDLNYNIPRNSQTPLNMTEYKYCINDVKILCEFSHFAFETWIKPNKKVPLTKTGILRNEIKQNLKKKCKNLKQYGEMITACFPKQYQYKEWFNYLFRGGFVHTNFFYANDEIKNVLMYDITSSYPAQMLLRYYPVTPFVDDEFNDVNLNNKCCIMLAEFYGLNAVTYHSIESKHKVIDYKGVKLDNGRIYKADYIKVWLTELDFENYKLFYKWEKMTVIEFKTAKRGRLPSFITDVLKKHYIHKAELKKAGLSKTAEYALCKSGINSCFGMMVTRISLDKVTYSDDWYIEPLALDFDEEVQKQILLPQWGIYVSAHGRNQLLKTVYQIEQKVPNSVIYCDTDSIKTIYDEKIKLVIDEYNKSIGDLIKREKLINNAFNDIGMFELEYGKPVERFKAIGAKRYIYQIDGKYEITIAGLPKDVLPKIVDDPFKYFDMDGFIIPLDMSEKLTTAYNDEETTATVDGEEMRELSSVALYSIPFSMFSDFDYYSLVIGQEMSKERKYIHDKF